MRLHPASWGISVLCCTLAGCSLFDRGGYIERTERCEVKVVGVPSGHTKDWILTENCELEVDSEGLLPVDVDKAGDGS